MRGEVTYYDGRFPMPGEPYMLEGMETTDWLRLTLGRGETETAVHLTPEKRQDMWNGLVLHRIVLEHGNPASAGFKVVLRRDGRYDRALIDRARGCLETYGEVFAGMFGDGEYGRIAEIVRNAVSD